MPKEYTITLTEFSNFCMKRSLPFAFYHLPSSATIKIVAQKKTALQKLKKGKDYSGKKGFLFAPFAESKKIFGVLIKPDLLIELSNSSPFVLPKIKSKKDKTAQHEIELVQEAKTTYLTLVKKIKEEIAAGKFSKVVAARVIQKEKSKQFDVALFFRELCKQYPSAFVSLVYTPQFGLWIGASPEVLLQHDGHTFTTYSLAGTKAVSTKNKKTAFGKKEMEEQQMVTDYITKSLQKVSKINPVITGPEVMEAGNLLHLRTCFSFSSVAKKKWQKIAEALHPSPAVAGIPKKKAIAFIRENETQGRGFYSGYLGPVNLDGQINLYVNIRCMQVLERKLNIYVGCGITSGSNAADEWKETEIKTETLLSVLAKP